MYQLNDNKRLIEIGKAISASVFTQVWDGFEPISTCSKPPWELGNEHK